MSGVIPDITPEKLSRAVLEKLAAISPSKLPLVDGTTGLGVPIVTVGEVRRDRSQLCRPCHGANLPLPSEPIVFQKAITSLSGLNDRLVLPKDSKKSD